MRTALAVTHVAFEDLGSLGIELTHAGFNIEVIDACTTKMYTIDALDPGLIVVLGGPVGVYEHVSYPFIEEEIKLLQSRLAAKRPTLGICLGAQLIAAALGARVYAGLHGKELGWAPVIAGSDNITPPWFGALLTPGLRVLHWHGDTFDIPDGAARLAGTARYPNQAFAVGNYALALQFHPEVTVQGLERWYVGHAMELAQTGVGIPKLREETRICGPELETAARQLWRQWLDYVFNSTQNPADAKP